MFAKKCCRCTKPITGVYAVLSVTEICLLRNVVDVRAETEICLPLLVGILCGVLRRYVC